MKKPAKRHSRGSTLVELVVALGIVALLYSLGVMSVKSVPDRQAARHAAQQLSEEIRWIQQRAAGEGRPWRITFWQGTSTYRVERGDSCDAPAFAVTSERNLTNGLALTETSGLPDPVEIFYSCSGMREPWPMAIEVAAPDGYTQTVHVNEWAGVKVR